MRAEQDCTLSAPRLCTSKPTSRWGSQGLTEQRMVPGSSDTQGEQNALHCDLIGSLVADPWRWAPHRIMHMRKRATGQWTFETSALQSWAPCSLSTRRRLVKAEKRWVTKEGTTSLWQRLLLGPSDYYSKPWLEICCFEAWWGPGSTLCHGLALLIARYSSHLCPNHLSPCAKGPWGPTL